MADHVELEYERAILRACQQGDDERVLELLVGLKQYRESYKDEGRP